MKWSIISKFVMIIIFFFKFIDQLIDYPINCASLSIHTGTRSCKTSIGINDSG